MDFREQEVRKLENNPDFTIGDVTTINLTTIKGGLQMNVVPPLLTIGFDVRLAISQSHDEFEALVNCTILVDRIRGIKSDFSINFQITRWCEEAGGNIEISYESKKPKVEPTKIDDTNPYWVAFKSCICDDL